MINRVGFVLIKPQRPENIGFCARALKNFGFKKLDLVDPKEKLPNRKAIATSVGANDILKKAKIYSDIKSAINGYDIVYASSARKRDINKNTTYSTNKDSKNYAKKTSKVIGSPASGKNRRPGGKAMGGMMKSKMASKVILLQMCKSKMKSKMKSKTW